MHDIKALRDDPAAFVRGWSSRGMTDAQARVEEARALDERLRAAQTALQVAQGQRNDASKKIGQAKAAKDEAEATRLMAQVEALKATLEAQTAIERETREALLGTGGLLARLPNLPAADVPEGPDEESNVEIESHRFGEPTTFAAPRDHVDIGEGLGLMDVEAAGRMSGSRFTVLKGQLARLERALGQFMLDMQTLEHGYTEVSPPLLVRDEAMFGTGQLPKFEKDLFAVRSLDWDDIEAVAVRLGEEVAPEANRQIGQLLDEQRALGLSPEEYRQRESEIVASGLQQTGAHIAAHLQQRIASGGFEANHWLIPTAEVSLTNLVREQITPVEELPLRLTALTPCFRSEAGASGKDTRGMIRQHQFYKVELVAITAPEESDAEHERMIANAEAVLKRLELPFRAMQLCAGDMGFSARRTVDLEVWLPSQGRYREISSISNCGDFQARRMDARTKAAGEKGTRFVHTLNGSGLAVGRTLVAIMENYQDENGAIAIPQALHPYMRGLTRIEKAA